MNRRKFLTAGAGLATVLGGGALWLKRHTAAAAQRFEIEKTDAEWRQALTPAQYSVLREEGTERPFTSPLNDEKRSGIYHCAGCDLAIYSSQAKYDSGTGWPSFYESLPNAVGTKRDFKLVYPRTEVHCRRCGGHLGHIFNDGPPPTGMRHCLNGVALSFRAA